jgi:predicted permease
VLGLTAAVAVFTTLLFGLAPALRGTRVEPGPMAKAGEEALAGGWLFGLRNSLIVGQVAVSLVLLVGAGLFLRSLRAASAAPLGMEPQNVLVASFDPRAAGYSNERAAGLFRRLTESVRAMPGVESASVTDTLPLSYMPGAVGVARPGSDDTIIADIYGVTPQHFRTLGIPLRQGQDLAEQQEGVPQLVINEAAAARLFGAENPVGAALDWEGMRHLVAGVARNAKSRSTGEPARPQIFVPLEKEYRYFWGLSGVTLCVRTRDGAGGLLPLIESRIRETEPDLAIYNAGTMPEHVDRALVIPRLCSWLFGIFGGVALLLAAVGLYGVMSYSVRRRSREIGIRLAIGARPAQLARMLAWQGLGLAAAGAALGLAAAGAVSRVLAGFLFGVGSRDPLTFAAVPLVLAATALAAVLIPAARAVRADALRSIRYE